MENRQRQICWVDFVKSELYTVFDWTKSGAVFQQFSGMLVWNWELEVYIIEAVILKFEEPDKAYGFDLKAIWF